jgi:exosortase A
MNRRVQGSSRVDMAIPAPNPSVSGSQSWKTASALLGILLLWLVAWYWDTLVSMISIWYRSETFAHGFVVFPIAGWLVWRQRRELAELVPTPSTSGLPIVLMLAGTAIWLTGDLADLLAARQLGWITMVIAGTWWIVGDEIARRLAFPLAFLYFAVPMGEFLMPTLIEWTADFTVAALRASGVPVWREGTTFQIPTGSWSVVDACSGLRYLIASVLVGVLFAYLVYRTLWRRIVFVAASLLAPVVANWLRAYMIVMIGHLSGNRLAVGIDHLIYGWIFFGVVMLLLFWFGSLLREDSGTEESSPEHRELHLAPARTSASLSRWAVASLAAFALTIAAPGVSRLLSGYPTSTGPIETAAPSLGDWHPTSGPSLSPWLPQFTPPRATIESTYARADERAGVYVAIYHDQDRASKLVSSENQLIRTTDRTGYIISEQTRTVATNEGHPLTARETLIRVGDKRILVRSWFWIDGVSTASELHVKLAQARSRLRGQGDAGAIIVVYALLPSEGEPASPALDDFMRQAHKIFPRVLAERLKVGDAG